MKTLKVQFVIAAALFAGVAIGYFARPSEADVSTEEDAAYVPKKRIADKGGDSNERALRRRIAELERLLAKNGASSEAAISNAVAEAVKNLPQSERPRNPREWMESLKKNDPARYAQMTNRFAQMRQRHLDRARTSIEFLSSVDTSRMSAGARKTHDELQELIARREELEEQMHQENLTDDERRQLFGQLREIHAEMRKLEGEERQNLLEETAKALGFEGDAVKDITGTIQGIVEATGGNGRGGFGPPPEGGPGGPGPGGPGGR